MLCLLESFLVLNLLMNDPDMGAIALSAGFLPISIHSRYHNKLRKLSMMGMFT